MGNAKSQPSFCFATPDKSFLQNVLSGSATQLLAIQIAILYDRGSLAHDSRTSAEPKGLTQPVSKEENTLGKRVGNAVCEKTNFEREWAAKECRERTRFSKTRWRIQYVRHARDPW